MFTRNKKGFTIVELVIVIAVIAILAAVLIPTFATVIGNANKSTALQACKSASSEYLSAQMQENPGKTAKEILRNKYFAYDDDDTPGLQGGEYKFRFDNNGQNLSAPKDDETVSTDSNHLTGWSQAVPGSKVYVK